ncbi:MAG: hypothetical protein KDC46_04020 [Thermoleophilia bacterium]|nr:hypothetical protein [Thermoleophilia bacterium]
MAANVASTTAHQPSLALPVRVRRPRPRMVLALVILLVVALCAAAPEQVASAANAACTVGNPDTVTCGEALVLLGYP